MRIHPQDYFDHHPIPVEVFLVIEVAEGALSYDRKKKAASYSKAGIADYWVIDVKNQQVFVFKEPGARTYQQETVWDKIALMVLQCLDTTAEAPAVECAGNSDDIF